ncbi:Ca2+/H+ antiporter [Candida orthopsilosis Co 90-125]|uniref:Ca2+/H+ antiporter n=1 Tax=Candida orthopsilosis (strain 90-125) TaxID=1136231 RepID=H8X5W7_CANO9|nr:Ca2+/H+ antiporter [Candida orthopsilosis Co 90-125]CCG22881.1 Ca2+/H+ antiporter [Candida orthopsilosis Co 90-125]
MSTPIAGASSKPNTQRTFSDDQRDPGSSAVSLAGSTSRNRSTSVQRRKSKPTLKKQGSVSHPKLIFSVDDDINEQADENGDRPHGEEQDNKIKNDKDYLEGYNDALRAFHQRKSSKSPMRSYQDISERTPLRTPDELADIESVIARDLQEAEQNIRRLKATDPKRFGSVDKLDFIENHQGNEDGEDNEDADENGSIHSNSSTESLNLKDRQNAINETHPFGIKIWKPSLYKKKRSVATRADEDIHDFDPRRPTSSRIFWGVRLTNMIWSLTAGLLIYVACLIGAIFVFVFSGFAINPGSRLYVRAFLRLGRYWLYPFGKFVLLNKDKNYMDEDQLEGRTLNEFHQWRLQEEGRLFFAPPRRYTGSAEESAPLMKDHKGRPLRDAYNSLATDNEPNEQRQNGEADDNEESNDIKVRFFGRGDWTAGRIAFYLYFYLIVQPISYFFGFLSWLIVFTIPMANITSTLNDHVRRHPLALDFEMEKEYYKRREKDPSLKKKKQVILLCTYRCCGWHYYKYTMDGTNIFFINLLFMVLFVIVDFYFLKESLRWDSFLTDSNTIFCLCLFSIIPLAYFIGQAVASISAQSSMGVGAVINAFFSTIVEIFLYCVALNQSKGKLVEGSMIGSILGGVLLLPGLSMCGGALKRKTQRYNPRSAGVSSTMLLFAMVTMFAPSLFYQIYGSYEIKCSGCDEGKGLDDCTKCRFTQPSFTLDPLYYKVVKPFSLIVAIALFAAYVCGLFFTLRTHASLIWATNSHEAMKKEEQQRTPSVANVAALDQSKPQSSQQRLSIAPSRNLDRRSVESIVSASEADVTKEGKEDSEEGGGHDAPNWSKKKSTIILLGATVLYAIIAEILVDNVDSILSDFPIDPKFLGLTIFALVPNTTEFLNAISFAIGGNVALSMEIGSAYALQVVLIQIPCLVVYSVLKNFINVEQIFSLVFPRWDIIATLISIYLFTYIYAEGKSNYFKGVILILIYLVVMIGFWFNGIIDGLDDGLGDYSVLRGL